MVADSLFSIIIPTRNRAKLLVGALASVLAQDFPDYELVVCDNASSDGTPDVAQSTGDPRVRYVRRPAVLSMPDSWEAAWREANGRYVLYLSDDDMLIPGVLRYLAEIVLPRGPKLVSWSGALHYTEDSPESELRGSLRVPVGSSYLEEHSGSSLAGELHRFVDRIWYPHLMNCCADRSKFDEIRERHGRLFFPPAPDYSFMSLAAQELDSFLVNRAPLYLVGRTGLSVGSSFHERSSNGEVQRGFLSEFSDDPLGPCACKAPVVPNYIAATLLNVAKARLARGLHSVDLDWAAYVRAVGYYMGRQRRHIGSFEQHAGELLALARTLGPELERTANALICPVPPTRAGDDRALRQALRKAKSFFAGESSDAAPFGGRWMEDEWLGRSLLIPLCNLTVDGAIDLARRLPSIAKELEAHCDPALAGLVEQ